MGDYPKPLRSGMIWPGSCTPATLKVRPFPFPGRWFADADRRGSPICPRSLSCQRPAGCAFRGRSLGLELFHHWGLISPWLLPLTNDLAIPATAVAVRFPQVGGGLGCQSSRSACFRLRSPAYCALYAFAPKAVGAHCWSQQPVTHRRGSAAVHTRDHQLTRSPSARYGHD